MAKLVRDLVPDIIRSTGVEPDIRVADPGKEYWYLLMEKLVEEVNEARRALRAPAMIAESIDELVDVLEVIQTIAGMLGITPDDLEYHRAAKATKRGGFGGRVVWSGNYPRSGR